MQAEPTLDGLPIELKIQILSHVLDGDTLKSIVHASPGYHQAYLVVRHELLESLVKHQYSGFLDLAEALTAVRSKGVHFSDKMGNVISLLDNWRRRDEIRELSQSSLHRIDQSNGLEETIKLFHFHKMLCFFLEDYSVNAPRPPWIQPIQWEKECLPLLHLSHSEKCRFLRAMCRLQIMKNVFGDSVYCLKRGSCPSCRRGRKQIWQLAETDELKDVEGGYGGSVENIAYKLFYGTIPPWEYEEMGGVFRYLVSKVEAVAQEIIDDLRQLSKNTPCERFWDILPAEQRPPPASEMDCEQDLVNFHLQYAGFAGLGPEFLHRILHMDRLSRRNNLCINKRAFWPGPFIGTSTGLSWDERFPFIDPADRHQALNFEQFWATLPPLEQPTEGWKKAWLLPHEEGDTIEDCLDYNRRTETDWEWNYALWDERRLRVWEALKLCT